MRPSGKRLFLFLLLELIGLCLIASLRFITLESTVTLVVFNLLFASLISQLEGTVWRKLVLLGLGNLVGLFWNFIFHYFALSGAALFGRTFDPFYTIVYPFLNLMWIVPFWSLSLSFLPRVERFGGDKLP
ncbi:MAG: hypothetical protein ACE14S_06535 [Candidatus Bathyarchaeia archaeon]